MCRLPIGGTEVKESYFFLTQMSDKLQLLLGGEVRARVEKLSLAVGHPDTRLEAQIREKDMRAWQEPNREGTNL